ncbi:hypothetical protein [Streptomyces aureocirculatus]|uniref:hypothetical protein n=1 Tax=Streptomyces aureocirculatus TaxID=67275 RepID=UPI001CEDEE9C|nr:hypothetical protein [Streptomyces aureocirculatus]
MESPESGVGPLARWAHARGLGFTHIVLARGTTRSQPMVNLRGTGGLTAQLDASGRVVDDLARAEFRAVRVKVEAAPWAAGVPRHDAEAARAGSGPYFEHHVKLRLPAGHDRGALAALVAPHRAHLSWNARRTRADGREERFVTQRCHGVGRATATDLLAALLADLADAHILEVEREYVLYDTNLSLDDGWMDLETAS